jgi:hypothetical protein
MGIPNFMKNCDRPVPTNDGALHDAPGLEFPEWSGMVQRRSGMTFEEAVLWNDSMLAMLPGRKMSDKLEAERRCDVEFTP